MGTARARIAVQSSQLIMLPLRDDIQDLHLQRLEAEGADVIGHYVHRLDGTNHPHYLHHAENREFHRFWKRMTCRDDPTVILNMFGTGSFWTRTAFDAVAEREEPFPIYLELYLPTLAHHLGFRVRGMPDQSRYVTILSDMESEIELARVAGAWGVHPVKYFWRANRSK